MTAQAEEQPASGQDMNALIRQRLGRAPAADHAEPDQPGETVPGFDGGARTALPPASGPGQWLRDAFDEQRYGGRVRR